MQQSDALEAAALLVKLRAHSSSADVQADCCAASDGYVQRWACTALWRLTIQNAVCQAEAAAAAGIEAAVAALRAHAADVQMQIDGCDALGSICRDMLFRQWKCGKRTPQTV
jgi:hypothetical protein